MNYGDRGEVLVIHVTGDGFEAKFLPLANFDFRPPDVPTARNVGLTRAFLDWEVRWDNVSSDIHEVIDGFMVFVYPDQKSSEVLVPQGGFGFALPKFVHVKKGSSYCPVPVSGFSVGGLYHYPDISAGKPDGSDSLVRDRLGEYKDLKPAGVERVREDYESFNKLIHNMPLAPGFVHGFEVAPTWESRPVPTFSWAPGRRELS